MAHVLYGIAGITAIWVFMPNPRGLPVVVTILGLILAGVLLGLFDGYRLARRLIDENGVATLPERRHDARVAPTVKKRQDDR